ncbi:hypothetical protein Pan44_32070 [Caulifigura coniformis]|uniref:Uncharacterized protein n=1 Tax=Caulifigura coniformis TaxID=2527983 RepID=A0A517SGA1_9PLAN|nr:hypothetical protein [Caulifigura coniformis]QDT55165.1 hypothetical protein Pan44_32070 [Caulifigura coniformis]
MVETPADVSPHATAHEETDVNVRALKTFLICLVVSLSVTALLVYWQYRRAEALALANDPPPSPRADERTTLTGPGLQINELGDGAEFRRGQEAELNSLAWVSKEEKLVRIPVSQAMEHVAKHGLPKWPAPPAQPAPGANP